MDKIEIINAIYHEYFLNDLVASESFDFTLDADRIYVIRNINKFDNLSKQEIIENVRNRFLSFINSDDPNVVDKQTLHITHPLYISIQRCLILFETIKKISDIDLKMDFEEFTTITHMIIFRVLLYNTYAMYSITNEIEHYYNSFKCIFGKEKISNWFTAEEIHSLNKNISIAKINNYLDLFSIDISSINSVLDPFKIIKNSKSNEYTLIFLHDFTYNLYQMLEDIILSKFNKNDQKISEYGNIRGTMFEKYIVLLLNDSISKKNIYTNYYYRDIDGNDSELDVLVEFDNLLLNIECKSSRFDPMLANNPGILDDRFIKAYKRSYESIDRFQRTIEGKQIITLRKEGSKKLLDIRNKKVVSVHATAYDMRYISTEIQRNIITSLPKYKYFPININCIDLQCMLLEIRFGGKGDKNFQKYLMNRFEMINSQKNLKFDVDEIDVYGYFIDENESNIKTLNILKEYANIDIQIDLMISNGIYREKINKELSEMFFENRIIDFTEETISDYIIRIFTKNN
jgi:hypothetical protein